MIPIDINNTNCIYFNCCKSLNITNDNGTIDSNTNDNDAGIIIYNNALCCLK